jgi:hypothetical protein
MRDHARHSPPLLPISHLPLLVEGKAVRVNDIALIPQPSKASCIALR